jgi:hypothetical protein
VLSALVIHGQPSSLVELHAALMVGDVPYTPTQLEQRKFPAQLKAPLQNFQQAGKRKGKLMIPI